LQETTYLDDLKKSKAFKDWEIEKEKSHKEVIKLCEELATIKKENLDL